ncbi:MAG: UpxY family transcription antiterminator [Sphingobacteriales bacterium]|nr:MAG: UpxY family transcription antiterminator [Sphingobacteriales bacterium]
MTQKQTKSNSEYNWYVWYTKPRAEKKLQERLIAKGVDVFLPLRKELRQWSDRKKWVETPLFNGYIFTNISQREREKVSFTEGIITYVRSEGRPAVIPQLQIDQIRFFLNESEMIEITMVDKIMPGELVKVTKGPFAGRHGEMINYKGSYKLAVRLEQIGSVLLVHLPTDYIKSFKKS